MTTTPQVGERWWARAACAGVGTEPFYSGKNTRAALDYCNACEVQPECLAEALRIEASEPAAHRRFGIWGGLVPNQRIALAKGELNRVGFACQTCGHEFYSASTRAMYCSLPCAQRAARMKGSVPIGNISPEPAPEPAP